MDDRMGAAPRLGAGEGDMVDYVAIDGLSEPVWIGIASASAGLQFFAVAGEGGTRDILATPLFQQEVLGRLIACRRLPTRHGRFEFDAGAPLPPLPWRLAVADSGSSSNCVSRLEAGAQPLVHKVYRQLSPANVELDASLRLGQIDAQLLAPCVGGYRYFGAGGQTLTIGLITQYVAGEGVYAAMSRDLRALWPSQSSQADPALLGELGEWRAFLARFHGVIERAFGAGPAAPAFDLPAYCTDARARLARLRPRLQGDALLAPAAARHLAQLFDRLEATYFGAPGDTELPLRATACHGDLHLSHLLWQGEGAVGQRRLIDFSPPALTPVDARFRASSHLLDWAALERALDYFFLDEAALALALDTGIGQQQTMAGLIGQAMQGRAEPPASLRARGERWRAQVRQALCGRADSRAQRRFYFGRLLQELEYNYEHQRPYYRCIDFCSLIEQFSHSPKE